MTTQSKHAPTSEKIGNFTLLRFESVDQAIEFGMDEGKGASESGIKHGDDMLKNSRTATGWEKSFFNSYTPEKLRADFALSPQKIVDAVEQMREKIEDLVQADETMAEVPVRRRKLRRNRDMGDELCPIAHVQRRLDGWSRIEKNERKKELARIAINFSTNASQGASELLYRGAVATAIADIYATQGRSVEIVAYDCGSSVSSTISNLMMEIPIKRSDAPMDLGQVAFTTAEVGFYRLGILGCVCRGAGGRVSSGLGRAISMPRELKKGFDVVIDIQITTQDQAVKFVTDHFKKQMAK